MTKHSDLHSHSVGADQLVLARALASLALELLQRTDESQLASLVVVLKHEKL